MDSVSEYIKSLLSSSRMKDQVVFHREIPVKRALYKKIEDKWPEEIEGVLKEINKQRLYSHQAEAMNHIRNGKNVVISTPTASGKTLIYNLPVLEKILVQPDARALYIFPLKALAQDQLKTFEEMAGKFRDRSPSAAIYDGDTSAYRRKKIREAIPNVIMTNPDMLHFSLLPYHDKWAELFKNLQIVVIDEVHTYRGVMGSHMAQVFKRLIRICSFYGSSPVFVFSSATVLNPVKLTNQLTGLKVIAITKSGAPQGKRNIIFFNPITGPAQAAILMLKAALPRALRTIVYTQSRKMTELIAIWAGSKSGQFARQISAYRAGFLPEERREIEAKLSSGEFLAVISTSALELGIDIGDLDLCVLVGYPGSVMATWQRGGRVGRSGQDSAWIMVAGEDALDQYFMRNPDDFLSREPEAAVINPYNRSILKRHLVCAAAELPLEIDETYMADQPVKEAVEKIEKSGDLLRGAEGDRWYSKRKFPQRRVELRGTGEGFSIVDKDTGESRGNMDSFRAFFEAHPGAIYLHHGNTFLVDTLDLDTRTIKVSQVKVDYYTKARSHKDTEILEILNEKNVWGTKLYYGRLKVTDQVTGFDKWRIHAKKRISSIPLDLPPLIFETDGIWFEIPLSIQEKTESKFMHFMGGIHAVEHALIGLFPLFVLADRNDLGGISITYHPQVNSAAVFIYDSVPGGAGLSSQAFKRAEDLLHTTLKVIMSCPCENGCPSCVHSPKCGSGNRPIDKESAVYILDALKHVEITTEKVIKSEVKQSEKQKRDANRDVNKHGDIYYGVFDIETQKSAQEVGGWHRADLMKVSCIVLYDSKKDQYLEFLEDQMDDFINHIKKYDLIIGFNNKRFDNLVLKGYSDFDIGSLPTLDILENVHNRLGYRLSLDNLAKATLNAEKTADGFQALRWWKQGKIREIVDYCKMDVEITRDLYLYGQKFGYLLFTNKAKKRVRVPVDW